MNKNKNEIWRWDLKHHVKVTKPLGDFFNFQVFWVNPLSPGSVHTWHPELRQPHLPGWRIISGIWMGKKIEK